MMKIGIIPCGCAPYHNGHHLLISTASLENDAVFVYTSTKDRIRKNEIPIFWRDMSYIWNNIILQNLPKNVDVLFVDKSPILSTWNLLDSYKDNVNVQLSIYGDPKDNDNRFNKIILQKYIPTLYKNNQIIVKSFDRNLTNGISGTLMRMFLKQNNKKMFLENLPFDEEENEMIWKILKK